MRYLHSTFIAAVITAAKRKQTKCRWVDAWIITTWCRCPRGYHSTLNRNFWHMRNLGNLMLTKIDLSENNRCCMIPLMDVIYVVRFIGAKSRIVVSRGWGQKERWNCYLTGMKFQICKMNKFYRFVSKQCEYIWYHLTGHLKMVKMTNFTLCISCQN